MKENLANILKWISGIGASLITACVIYIMVSINAANASLLLISNQIKNIEEKNKFTYDLLNSQINTVRTEIIEIRARLLDIERKQVKP